MNRPERTGERFRSLCARCELVVVSYEPYEWHHATTRDAAGAVHDGEAADETHHAIPIAFLTQPSGEP